MFVRSDLIPGFVDHNERRTTLFTKVKSPFYSYSLRKLYLFYSEETIYHPTSCVRKDLNTNLPLLIEAIYLIRRFHDNVDVYNILHFPGRHVGYNCHFLLTQKTSAELQQLSCMRGSYGRGWK